jgi:predicted deacylase
LTVDRSFLPVTCTDHPLQLPIHRFGRELDSTNPRILITAGVHGRENGGIQTAYALLEHLVGVSEFHGMIDVLPVANPQGLAAEARNNPVDGKNLGECFTESGVEGAELDGEETGQTEAIARAILAHLSGCAHLLDLHSAGEARYLPHVVFFRKEQARSAAAAGLSVALLRETTREGRRTGMLCQAASSRGIPALALELGGGITTWPKDVHIGVRAVLSLLAHWGYLSPERAAEPTQPARVYLRDSRAFLRAKEEGIFYPSGEVGQAVRKNNRIGTWVSLENLEARPVAASGEGTVLYLRTRCRTHRGDTLAMVLPPHAVERGDKE